MLSRKHYISIAKIIKDNSVDVVDETTQDGNTTSYINKDNFVDELSAYLHADNNAFNWTRFVYACNEVDE